MPCFPFRERGTAYIQKHNLNKNSICNKIKYIEFVGELWDKVKKSSIFSQSCEMKGKPFLNKYLV